MEKGYQIVESRSIAPLLATSGGRSIARIILNWAMPKIQNLIDQSANGIRASVIDVQFHSNPDTYPAIGLQYDNPDADDMEDAVLAFIESLMVETSLHQFAKVASE